MYILCIDYIERGCLAVGTGNVINGVSIRIGMWQL